jgi:tryptophan synthase alpha chain
MNRLEKTFADASDAQRACFIAYVCAGDPDFDTSVAVCRRLHESGVDIIELGVPFSDPLADGVPNQLAAQRALESGMNRGKVAALISAVRQFSEKPIILYTYYNLAFSPGVDAYVQEMKTAGVDGLLVLDLPPEEADEVVEACRRRGMANIFIVAPTTPPQRVREIASYASGFLYYVSRAGVTGERESLVDDLAVAVAEVKRHADIPVVVGFGISTPEHVRAVASIADGVVVGSALVNCIYRNLDDRDAMLAALTGKLNVLYEGIES